MDTLMRMPIQDRRYYIIKHNEDAEGLKQRSEGDKNKQTVQGEALNAFAQLEQKKNDNGRR